MREVSAKILSGSHQDPVRSDSHIRRGS
jgi:hypothetical protein